MKRVKIDVKDHHIKNGIQESSSSCPVALATQEVMQKANVIVDTDIMYINLVSIKSPTRVTRAISKFDNNREMTPFTFYLNLPEGEEEDGQGVTV